MTVVSTSDSDPLACMNELHSKHYAPPSLISGMYDPDIIRVCVLIHDASAPNTCHVPTVLKQVCGATVLTIMHSVSTIIYVHPTHSCKLPIPLVGPRC
jgi:hypothetical protein